MTTGMKLAIGGLVIAGASAYMAYLGAAASWTYYLTVDECLAAESLGGERIRVSGRIASGSLDVSADRRRVSFSLEGTEASLPVTCPGPPPDNLAENGQVVVEGRLDSGGLLRGEKVLTRCASKYEAEGGSAASTTARPASERGS